MRLRHIADSLRSAIGFTDGHRREDLDTDEQLTFALIYALQVAGEAASKLTVETRKLHTAIPWAQLVGMRNRLVHACADVNLDILWTTVTEAAPVMLAQVEPLLD